jgi:antitoxin HicB
MSGGRTRKRHNYSGSTFDSFLEEHGIREEVEAVATKRVLAWQLGREMKKQRKTKQAMARELRTSRSQLDRLLDPHNTAVTLETITAPQGSSARDLCSALPPGAAPNEINFYARRSQKCLRDLEFLESLACVEVSMYDDSR